MVGRISDQSILSTFYNISQQTQEQYAQVSVALDTGQKYQSLSSYGLDLPSVVTLQNDIGSIDQYKQTNADVKTIGKQYDTNLSTINDFMRQAQTYLNKIGTGDDDDPMVGDLKAFQKHLTSFTDTLLKGLTNQLNSQLLNKYSFAGSNYDDPPVVDLTTMPLYGKGDIPVVPITIAQEPDLPVMTRNLAGHPTENSYMNQYNPYATPPVTQDPNAWHIDSANIDKDMSMSYGITATDPAIQHAVDALIRMKSIANLDPKDPKFKDDVTAFKDEANNQLKDAMEGIKVLQTSNGLMMDINNTITDKHTQVQHIFSSALTGYTEINQDTYAAQSKMLQQTMNMTTQFITNMLSMLYPQRA